MTATNGTAPAAPVVGLVEQVNEKGCKVGGAWHNFSKFSAVAPPERGQLVELRLDKSGFVRAIAPLNDQVDSLPPTGGRGPDRETTITRLAVLKAAAEFAASKPEAKSNDVLRIAECWEAWVIR